MDRKSIEVSKDEIRNDIESENIYRGKIELVLVSLLKLYSEPKSIFVGTSRSSSCLISHCLLTI